MLKCGPAQKFAKNDKIGQFLESAKNGVIYTSFGSHIQASKMPEDLRKKLANVFAKLKPMKVLWKWETEQMPDMPDNVMLSKWLPQQDVLRHPNVKLFISHGGQSSFQETICHKKPMVYKLQ
jgi:glucuronosyltransferase